MAAIPGLSREYVYIGISGLNVAVADITVHQLAFMGAGEEPLEADWEDAILVDDDTHPLWRASIGPAYAILIGPDRGDVVTTLDLPDADYQVWTDTKVTGSDERIVRIAGTLDVNLTGE